MLIPNFNIPKILTLITAPIFNIFSIDWSTKVCISEAPPEDES